MKREARRLRVLRAEKDVTQERVAQLAGMSAARYWQIENGFRSEASADEKSAVAAALGVKVADVAWPVAAKAKAS